MNLDKPQKVTITLGHEDPHDIQKRDDVQFRAEIDALVKQAEEKRLDLMRRYKTRSNIVIFAGVILVLAGAFGFGWFFLMEGQLLLGLLAIFGALAPLGLSSYWTRAPLKSYKHDYKKDFMPKLAEALGGLKFHPKRGISSNVLKKTGIIPPYDEYQAEDCFMGKYKGVKVIFSEAHLYRQKDGREPVFDGIFVLLETPQQLIEGHTIITADTTMVKEWQDTRWKKLQKVLIRKSDGKMPDDNIDRFQVFSSAPEDAGLLVGERLLKELGEAADIFKGALLSAVLFNKKYIFISIPYPIDMFEPSDISAPVQTKQHAMQAKKEIEQIMELIDVFELYNAKSVSMSE